MFIFFIALTIQIKPSHFENGEELEEIPQPKEMGILDNYSLNGIPQKIVIKGGLAYITTNASINNFYILNVTDAYNINLLSVMNLTTIGTKGLAIDGNWAYVALPDIGLGVINITNPSDPYLYMNITAGIANQSDVAIDGDVAFLAGACLTALNISTPVPTVITDFYDFYPTSIEIKGDIAYIGSKEFYSGFYLVNITNPNNMYVLRATSGSAVSTVSVSGDLAFGTVSNAILIYDITNYGSFMQINSISESANSVSKFGNWLYACTNTSVKVYNMSDPYNPNLMKNYSPISARFIQVIDNVAYIATDTGLITLSIGSFIPNDFAWKYTYDTDGEAMEMEISGKTGYIADGIQGIQIMDLSNLPSLTRVNGFPASDCVYDIEVHGNLLYVAEGMFGINIHNATGPDNLDNVGSYDTTGTAYAVAIHGDYLYVADGEAGVHVFNVFNPTNPILESTYDTLGNATDVNISGNRLYCADGTVGGLYCFDITDPAHMIYLSRYDSPGSAEKIELLDNNNVYLADGVFGFELVNFNNPSSPTLIINQDTWNYAHGIYVSGQHLYVADGENIGILSYNNTNYRSPSLTDHSYTQGETVDITLWGGFAFLCAKFSGVHILKMIQYEWEGIRPDAPSVSTIVPNPNTTGNVTLNWTAVAGATSYKIYNYTDMIHHLNASVNLLATTNQTFYYHYPLINGTYFYEVVACNASGDSNIFGDTQVKVELTSVSYPPPAPVMNAISPDPTYDGSINLTWSEVSGATYYGVYHYENWITSINGSLTFHGYYVNNSYTFDITSYGVVYFVVTAGNSSGESEISNCVSVFSYYLTTPMLNIIDPNPDTDGNITISWSSVGGAAGYRVFNSTSPITEINSSVTLLANTTQTWYNILDLTNGTYFYAVMAYNSTSTNSTVKNSTLSNTNSVTVEILSGPQILGVPVMNAIFPNPDPDGNVSITWSSVSGATEYKIYNYTGPIFQINESCNLLNTTTLTWYFHDLLTNGTYYYAVIASNASGNSSVSNWVNVTVAIPPILSNIPAAPVMNAISPNPDLDGNVSVTWSSVPGAAEYKIYNYTGPIYQINGSCNLLNTTTLTWYFHDYLTNGTYYYAVVASNATGNSSVSNWVNVTIGISPIIQYPPAPILYPIVPNPDIDGNINITYSEVLGCNYHIYRYTSPIDSINGSVQYCGSSGLLWFPINNPVNGTYYFVIIAYNGTGSSNVSNCEKVTVIVPPSGFILPNAPVLNIISPNPDYDGFINISWSEVPDTLVYNIYYDEDYFTEYGFQLHTILEINKTWCITHFLGGRYYFAVVAINETGYSVFSNCETVFVATVNKTTINQISPNPNTDGNVTINWATVSNTIYYLLYNYTSPIYSINASVNLLANTTQTWFNHYPLTNGTYFYAVVTVNNNGTSGVSNWANVTVAIPPGVMYLPPAPTLYQITPNPSTSGNISLSWSSVSGATSYRVYNYTGPITQINGSVNLLISTGAITYNHITLFNGTYYYVVVAVNGSGDSAVSNWVNVTISIPAGSQNPPSAPIMNLITPNPDTDGYISVNWSTVANVTNYYLYYYTSPIFSINGSVSLLLTTSLTWYDHNGLINGTYYYVVIASNSSGNSSLSNCVNITIAIPPGMQNLPSAPVVNVISPNPDSDGNITISWNPVSGASYYMVYNYTGPITQINGSVNAIANTTNTWCYHFTTINGTYYYAVVTFNASGNSSVSNWVNVTISIPPGTINLPSAPTLFAITPNPDNDGNITLNWSAVSGAGWYKIYNYTGPIVEINGSVNLIDITSLTWYYHVPLINGTYYYCIVANNVSGDSVVSNWVNVTVAIPPTSTPPSAPFVFQISPNPSSDGNVTITWTSVSGATAYRVYNYTGPITEINGSVNLLATTGAIFYNHFPLINGTYYYAVIAVNGSGDSSVSNWVNVTVAIPPGIQYSPAAPSMIPITPNPTPNGTVSIQWSTVIGATSYNLYRYGSYITILNGSVMLVNSFTTNQAQDILTNGTYYYVVTAVNGSGVSGISNCVNITVAIPPTSLTFYILIDQPINGSVYRSFFNLPLTFRALGASYQKYWYTLKEDGEWISIAGNTTFNVAKPGIYYLRVRGYTGSINITSEITEFNVSIERDYNAQLSFILSTDVDAFTAGSTIEIRVQISNNGSVDFTHLRVIFNNVPAEYRLVSNYDKIYNQVLAPGDTVSYILIIYNFNDTNELNFEIDIIADNYYVHLSLPLDTKTQGGQDIGALLTWSLTAMGAIGVAVLTIKIVRNIKRKKSNKKDPHEPKPDDSGENVDFQF